MTDLRQSCDSPTSGCPEREMLAAIHRGAADSSTVDAWASHIENCRLCQDILDEQPPELDRLFARFEGSAASTPFCGQNVAAPAADSQGDAAFPREFGDFVLEAELGRGGMGVVYRARQRKLNRVVALKLLRGQIVLDAESVKRFRTECEAVARLRHPNITVLFQNGWLDDVPWYTMEIMSGGALAQRLRGGPMSGPASAALVRTIALAVEYAHRNGVIHRDLKPSNVLLGEQDEPKVADFGLAKIANHSIDLTATDKVMGSPGYMSPEQAAGKTKLVGAATDVYALGAILYECLTGRPPFAGMTAMETIQQVIRDEPVPPRRIAATTPRDLETICMKCLDKPPARRYDSAQALADDLQRFLDGRPIAARPLGPLDRLWRWRRREPRLAAAAAVSIVLLLALIGSGYWFIYQSGRQALEVAQFRFQADANEAMRFQAEQARTASDRERQVLTYYRSLQDCDARSKSRSPGWTWENRAAIAIAANSGVDVPNRQSDLRTHVARCASFRDFRALGAITPSALTAVELEKLGPGKAAASQFPAYRMAFSPNGDLLAAGQHKVAIPFAPIHIALMDPDSGTTRKVLSFPSAGPVALARRGYVPDGIESLTFSPDGNWLAAGAVSGKIHLYNLQMEPPKQTSWMTPAPSVVDLCFGGDSRTLFSKSEDFVVRRWDIGGTLPPQQPSHSYGRPDKELYGVQIVPKNLAIDGPEAVLIEERGTGMSFLKTENLERFGVTIKSPISRNPAVSPDGRTIAVEEEDGLISIMERVYGQRTQKCRRLGMETSEDSAITWLCFTPDGSLLLSTAMYANRIRLWETASGRMLGEAFVPGGFLGMQAVVRPDGKMFVVAGQGGKLYRFELSAAIEQTFAAIGAYPLIGFEPHATRTNVVTISYVGGNWGGLAEMAVWDWARAGREPEAWRPLMQKRDSTCLPLFTHEDPSRVACFQIDELFLWPFVEKDRTGKVHELGRHNETKLMAWRAPGELWIADDSKDKRLLSWKLSESKPREIWNNRIRHALGGVSNFTCMKVGSRYALLGLRDGAVAVLDVATEKFERYVNLSPGAIRCVALSSDESWALAGDEQGQLHRFTLPEGRADPPLAAHHDSVDQVAVQRDSLIISASADLHVRFARIDGETLFSLKLPRPVKLMRLTPEGKNLLLLLREERALRVWHLDRLEQAFEQLGAGVRLVP